MVSKVREKIVNAALERFHALGFSACGIQEIVDKAGVPKGSFYNYFKAKELLATEVLEIYAKGSRREILADRTVPPIVPAPRLALALPIGLSCRTLRTGYNATSRLDGQCLRRPRSRGRVMETRSCAMGQALPSHFAGTRRPVIRVE